MQESALNRFVEVAVLLAVCGYVYFANIHHHEYIGTEGLRAVVVEEMLARPGLSMPTVHADPYLKKPPLYAWTTTLVARALGRFDEQVARMPSGVSATLLILVMYLLGERWIGRGGGFAAAILTLLNPTIGDYGVRAELDLPFSLLCTGSLAVALEAINRRGVAAFVSWFAVYFLALAAALWKGPHSLIFLWLTLIGYGWIRNDWRFLKAPAQWMMLVAVLGTLVYWTSALAEFAGPSSVGRAAGIELFSRLLPHKAGHFLSILTFLPMLVVITVPASVFALLTFRDDVRNSCGLAVAAQAGELPIVRDTKAQQLRNTLQDWWKSLTTNRLGALLLAWLIPNLIFMTIAPAKSPRYTIPVFPPMILFGAWVMILLETHGRDAHIARHGRRVWRVVFAVPAVLGLGSLIRLIAGFAGTTLGIGRVDEHAIWAMLAAGTLLPLVIELSSKHGRSLRTRLLLCLLLLLALQPALHGILWPMREASDSQRDFCVAAERLVPASETIYVIGKREYPDNQIYSGRLFHFLRTPEAIRERVAEGAFWALVQSDEVKKYIEPAGVDYELAHEFDRADDMHYILRISPRGSTG